LNIIVCLLFNLLNMSNIRRDHQKSFKINQRLNNKDDNQRYHRKRTNSNRSNDQFNLEET